ncbi:NHL repeat domain protein [Minicystis rosea]|nr:NHL repeat domain protein [Minicystis rosea]
MSTYLEHLPAVLQRGPFIGRLLLAFEAVLTGVPAQPGVDTPEGLEQILDRIHGFFDPSGAPEEFLPWLAEWVATSLRDEWSAETKRAFLGRIVQLYQKRGTLAGIREVLKLSVSGDVEVIEFDDTKPRHYFLVIVTVNQQDPTVLQRLLGRVREIIDREKPAHTFYGLEFRYPGMRINNDPAAAPTFGTAHWSHFRRSFSECSNASVQIISRFNPRPIVVEPGGPPEDLPV